jgi:hypothetical protein
VASSFGALHEVALASHRDSQSAVGTLPVPDEPPEPGGDVEEVDDEHATRSDQPK